MEKPQFCDLDRLAKQSEPRQPRTLLRSAIDKQIARFVNHVPLPNQDGISEIRQAFNSRCDDAEMVQKVGDRLMETAHYYPKPADVHEAADAVQETAAVLALAQNGRTWKDGYRCEICKDTAWISRDVNGYSVAERCRCSPLAKEAKA